MSHIMISQQLSLAAWRIIPFRSPIVTVLSLGTGALKAGVVGQLDTLYVSPDGGR